MKGTATAETLTPHAVRAARRSNAKFSVAFGVKRDDSDDWFDPVLSTDTKLFVDPFLIFLDEDPRWANAHDTIVAHFDRAFVELAKSGGNRKSLAYKVALSLLHFPEPSEFCLGYTARGTRGSGSGAHGAAQIADAMCDAIERGVQRLEHFEQLGIINEGIGPDRISDIVCTVLKPEFIAYTQDVARKLGVPLSSHVMRGVGFDARRLAGPATLTVDLPTNPKTHRPVVLVPQRFLRKLPALNAEDWFDSDEASKLRAEFNADVMNKVRKADIVRIARQHPDLVDAWTRRKEREGADPYDLSGDPAGVYAWVDDTLDYTEQNPLELKAPSTEDEFVEVITTIVERYKHYIEERRGWALLWNDNDASEKNEEAAQLAFQGIAASYCEANGIVIDREVELGRGPVDFKFSNGYEHRALLEVKKLHNGRFWNGLEQQLTSYMKSDQVNLGWFIAVRYLATGVSAKRVRQLPRRVAALSKDKGCAIRYKTVDARPKVSASKLRARQTRP